MIRIDQKKLLELEYQSTDHYPYELYHEEREIDRKINKSVKEVFISSVKHAMRAPLCARFKDLPTSNMKEILVQRMFEENYDTGLADHRVAYEALQDSIRRDACEYFDVDKAQEETKKKSKQDSLKPPPGSPPSPPPPPPPPSGASGASSTTGASDSAQAPPPPPPSLFTSSGVSQQATAAPRELVYLLKTGEWRHFMDGTVKQQGISELTPKDLEGPAFEIVKVFHHDVIHLQFQMEECHKLLTDQVDDAILRYNVSKPLPLGGEPGHVTIQPDFFFNKDLEYLRYGRKVGRPALSISKMKAAYYPDVGLEQLVPDQFWIEEECKYDIAAMYGISHWWFQRQRFYIDRFSSEGDRRAVRTHMLAYCRPKSTVFPIKLGLSDTQRKDIQLELKLQIQAKPHQTSMEATDLSSSMTTQSIDSPRHYIQRQIRINRTNPGDEQQILDKERCVDRAKDLHVRYPEG
ncbi:hypothetical protein Tco_1394596 [Tanacetum coccineum]